MTASGDPLDALRQDIDRIDTAIADLLRERMAVVTRIGEVKQAAGDAAARLALRPSREAQIINRLIGGYGDTVPPILLVRVWRELLSAGTSAQTPFAVAVCAAPPPDALWDLARDHFGASVELQRTDRPAQALRALADGLAQVALLPPPSDELGWWEGLVDGEPRLRVVAKLPFLTDPGDTPEPPEAFAVAELGPEPSGDDLTLLVIEASGAASRMGLKAQFEAAGLVSPRWIAVRRDSATDRAHHLVEVDGFVTSDDKRCRAVRAAQGSVIDRLVVIGAYARPVDSAPAA